MSAIQKEQIYVELRQYHENHFPETFSNSELNDLLKEYRNLEDEVIAMLLGLVNGKSEYMDLSNLPEKFMAKLDSVETSLPEESDEKEHFLAKVKSLQDILSLAEKATFKIRPVRQARVSTREVVTKITKE
jgi:hypothetical protein